MERFANDSTAAGIGGAGLVPTRSTLAKHGPADLPSPPVILPSVSENERRPSRTTQVLVKNASLLCDHHPATGTIGTSAVLLLGSTRRAGG